MFDRITRAPPAPWDDTLGVFHAPRKLTSYDATGRSGALFVDRFMSTPMHYPCNYGNIPNTLSDDGDPVDVRLITPVPLIPGVVVTYRPLGLPQMEDEAGGV